MYRNEQDGYCHLCKQFVRQGAGYRLGWYHHDIGRIYRIRCESCQNPKRSRNFGKNQAIQMAKLLKFSCNAHIVYVHYGDKELIGITERGEQEYPTIEKILEATESDGFTDAGYKYIMNVIMSKMNEKILLDKEESEKYERIINNTCEFIEALIPIIGIKAAIRIGALLTIQNDNIRPLTEKEKQEIKDSNVRRTL